MSQAWQLRPAAGRWILDAPLGSGGMATVWRAHRPGTPPLRVALKIPSEHGRDALRAEIEALASVRHPNVVELVEAGRDDAGEPWLALSWVHGETLADVLARDGALPPPTGLELFAQLVEALAHLHSRGIAHCDVKPANVMVTRDERVVLIDFGAARRLGEPLPNRIAGSAPWAPPEWATGAADLERWDVYSAGVVLYEMLTGRQAFPPPDRGDPAADAAAIMVAKATGGPLDPEAPFPHALRDLVRAATDPRPERRPASAMDLLVRLRAEDVGWFAMPAPDRRDASTWVGDDHSARAGTTVPPFERVVADPVRVRRAPGVDPWLATAIGTLALALVILTAAAAAIVLSVLT
jgi:serine/threonine protein kinase